MSPRALDLFAGMGGASLGLAYAGFDVQAIEFDETAAAMHDHVCGGNPTIVADISELEPRLWRHDDIELLWASPPCQPFSQAGLRKGFDDPRAHLIFQVPRWVNEIRPRYVICEQVKAALPWWEAFAREFNGLGYNTWTGLLHSEEFGVPQTRTRAFLLASLVDQVGAPTPTHRRYHTRAPHDRPTLDGRLPYVTMADVINIGHDDLVGFARLDDGAEAINGYRRRDFREGDDPAFTVTSKGRSWSVNTGRDWKPGGDRSTAQQRDSDCPAPTVTGDSSLNKWMLAGRQSKATERDSDKPAPTVTAGHDVSQWKLGSRLLTVQDGLALQSFPTDCLDDMEVTKTAAFKAIGNAVPPLWAKQIAKHVIGASNE